MSDSKRDASRRVHEFTLKCRLVESKMQGEAIYDVKLIEIPEEPTAELTDLDINTEDKGE